MTTSHLLNGKEDVVIYHLLKGGCHLLKMKEDDIITHLLNGKEDGPCPLYPRVLYTAARVQSKLILCESMGGRVVHSSILLSFLAGRDVQSSIRLSFLAGRDVQSSILLSFLAVRDAKMAISHESVHQKPPGGRVVPTEEPGQGIISTNIYIYIY